MDFCRGEKPKPEADPEDSKPSHYGHKITLVGMSTLALSFLVKNPLAARAMRLAGPVPMVLGGVLSIYEFGGWRLLLAIPSSILGASLPPD